ncbi:MAG: hypothetical protein WKF83_09210 [Nocardioidaceae bacterium]
MAVEVAAGWSWRLLVLAVALVVLYEVLSFFSEISVPLAVAVLLCALLAPLVDVGEKAGLPRGAGAGIVVVGGLALVVGMLTLVGHPGLDPGRGPAQRLSSRASPRSRPGPRPARSTCPTPRSGAVDRARRRTAIS